MNLKVNNTNTENSYNIIKDEFVAFFKSHKFDLNDRFDSYLLNRVTIKNVFDLNKLKYTRGFYVILTDYAYYDNTSTFMIKKNNGKLIKAVYRASSNNRKNDLVASLFNDLYIGKKKNFMNVNGENGINIDKAPYNDYTWVIVEYSISNNIDFIKLQMEKAFDEVFGKTLFIK